MGGMVPFIIVAALLTAILLGMSIKQITSGRSG
jgi:hypothetical protein